MRVQAGAADYSHVPNGTQALTLPVDRQSEGTSGIDADAWTPKIQQIGDAARSDTVRYAGAGMRANRIPVRDQEARIVRVDDGDEYARPAARQAVRSNAAVPKRFPGDFQQQPLQRIHTRRFPRCNPNQGRSNPFRGYHEPTASDVDSAGTLGVGIV